MITIELWENPLYDGVNPKWMAKANMKVGSGDTELQAIETVLGLLTPPACAILKEVDTK